MVTMMVGDEDGGQAEVRLRQGLLDPLGIARIDRRHLGLTIAEAVDQPQVIVNKSRYARDGQGGRCDFGNS